MFVVLFVKVVKIGAVREFLNALVIGVETHILVGVLAGWVLCHVIWGNYEGSV